MDVSCGVGEEPDRVGIISLLRIHTCIHLFLVTPERLGCSLRSLIYRRVWMLGRGMNERKGVRDRGDDVAYKDAIHLFFFPLVTHRLLASI